MDKALNNNKKKKSGRGLSEEAQKKADKPED